MILITFHGNDQWPVKLDDAKDVSPELARNAYSVTVTGDDLELIALELSGLPLPRYRNEWVDGFTWYWTDAATIIGNIAAAAKINKEATRGK